MTPGFIIQFCATPETEKKSIIRFGLTASTKVGNAVKRNRAKRRLRALANELLPLHAMPNHDYVLIARNDHSRTRFCRFEKRFALGAQETGRLS